MTMRIGVPLVTGTDPVPLALLDRLTGLVNDELLARGDGRRIEVVRLAASLEPVRTAGGTQVRPDATFEKDTGLDVVFLVGPVGDAGPGSEVARLIDWLDEARRDLQHLAAVGDGVALLLETHAASGRRVMMNHITPARRARFDAALPGHSDPCRDGDIWTASDPLHGMVLLLDLIDVLYGAKLRESVEFRTPWIGNLARTLRDDADQGALDASTLLGEPGHGIDGDDEDDDEDGGLEVRHG